MSAKPPATNTATAIAAAAMTTHIPALAALPIGGRACARMAGRGDWSPISLGGMSDRHRGQFRVGPRRQRLAHPQVELVLGQPPLHERGLEHFDRLLAVGVGRPEAATARRG